MRRRRGDGSVYKDRTLDRWVAKRHGRKVYANPNTRLGALQALEDLRRRYPDSINPASGTLDTYLRQWLDTLQGVRESTKVSYAIHIDRHISPLLGARLVSDLQSSDVRWLIKDRLDAGLSPSTVRRIHSTLHQALEQGVRERTLAENAAHGVSLPKVERSLIEAMTEDDADAIREAVKDTFLDALVTLLLGSGLRLGEALGLDQGDVQPERVIVRRTKGRQRAVAISQDASEALQAHISSLKVRGPREPVFFGPRSGKRLNGTTVSHSFPKMLLDAGLARLNPHGTRHGVASLLLAGGASMKEVSEQLGHRSVQTTDTFYAHISPIALRQNVQMLNRRRNAR